MNLKILLSFATVYIVWGTTFTAIKLGLEDFPPLMLSGLRFCIAGAIFLVLARKQIFQNMTKKDLTREILVGILLTCANAGICWAEEYISSGVAALIVAAIPIMFVLFNWISFEKKVPHITAILGLAIGCCGIVLISADGQSVGNWLIVLALIFANSLWVFGSLVTKNTQTNLSYLPRSAVQFLSGGIFLVSLSGVLGERAIIWNELSFVGIASLGYLALFGTIIAYTCYTHLLKNLSPEYVSTYALVNPMVAIIFGVIWLGEPLTLKIISATPLIILSVGLVIYGKKLYEEIWPTLKR